MIDLTRYQDVTAIQRILHTAKNHCRRGSVQ